MLIYALEVLKNFTDLKLLNDSVKIKKIYLYNSALFLSH